MTDFSNNVLFILNSEMKNINAVHGFWDSLITTRFCFFKDWNFFTSVFILEAS